MVLDGVVVSVLSILVGLYVGLVRGGLIRNLGTARAFWWGLLVVGVVLPVLVSRADPGRGVPLVALALVALIVFARRNRHLLGMGVVAVGVAANLLVLVVNDGMPVRRDALVDAGLAESIDVDYVEISGVQRLERDDDTLMFLADIIPLRATNQVLSVGDVVILAGLGIVSANLIRGRTRAATPPSARAAPAAEPRSGGKHRRERQIPDFEPIVLDDTAADRAGDLVGAVTPGR